MLRMKIIYGPVNKHVARPMLPGTSGVKEGPAIKGGITVTRLRLFSFANFQASLSARVLETG